MADADLVTSLRQAGVNRSNLVGLVISPALGLGLAAADRSWSVAGTGLAAEVGRADEELRPRWVLWSGQTAARLAAAGMRLATCWDIAAVHRLLFGGWRADPGLAWARLRGLATDPVPAGEPLDLFGSDLFGGDEGDASDPVAPDGHLRPEWLSGGWSDSPGRMARWAALALDVAGLQQAALAALDGRPMALATARSESAAELLCAELSADGLPMDRAVAEQLLASLIGPRPRSDADAMAQRAARDAEVLRHVPAGVTADLRSPAQVKSLLARMGVDVPDTRAWRLREMRDAHPLVGALLDWRKAERIATTYGYAWLDEHLAADGRLRGAWTGSDGAAGRIDRVGGPAQHAGCAAPGRDRRRGSRVRPGRPGPDRAAGARRGVRRPLPGDGGPLRRPVRAGGSPARRGPGGGQGGGPRRDVRADHRARRPGAAPPQRGLPGGDGLPRCRRPGRTGGS